MPAEYAVAVTPNVPTVLIEADRKRLMEQLAPTSATRGTKSDPTADANWLMGMKSVATARRMPLAEAPSINAVIDRIMKLPIERMRLEPASHRPESQHCFTSHFSNSGRTLQKDTQPLATGIAEPAKLATPDSKMKPELVQRAVADKNIAPPISTAAYVAAEAAATPSLRRR